MVSCLFSNTIGAARCVQIQQLTPRRPLSELGNHRFGLIRFTRNLVCSLYHYDHADRP